MVWIMYDYVCIQLVGTRYSKDYARFWLIPLTTITNQGSVDPGPGGGLHVLKYYISACT